MGKAPDQAFFRSCLCSAHLSSLRSLESCNLACLLSFLFSGTSRPVLPPNLIRFAHPTSLPYLLVLYPRRSTILKSEALRKSSTSRILRSRLYPPDRIWQDVV
ncbi:uncharacterized protein LY89DRAFT_690445 [Mollisia scopiformis]|uniref:Uncharacterized protein n=1 Tax=Mollisia scopiformis TaxID=149040 RepID=A0A132BAM0_MOLSC|nr:uncharacterized protein LY89DRAFT_690445 [Mollisia scopiformis]KUJ09431.1 hypothetical protein LY89DRAFT_690445 [Mollisia scopiformis]